ncbi:hypothetical protein AMECASPLE_021883 [Ameca splendens]|uniref:Secreted protein n=1 Tax=Ameca splendens TaxID=208324 RepID=A0ABV0Z2W2_9TELE
MAGGSWNQTHNLLIARRLLFLLSHSRLTMCLPWSCCHFDPPQTSILTEKSSQKKEQATGVESRPPSRRQGLQNTCRSSQSPSEPTTSHLHRHDHSLLPSSSVGFWWMIQLIWLCSQWLSQMFCLLSRSLFHRASRPQSLLLTVSLHQSLRHAAPEDQSPLFASGCFSP